MAVNPMGGILKNKSDSVIAKHFSQTFTMTNVGNK